MSQDVKDLNGRPAEKINCITSKFLSDMSHILIPIAVGFVIFKSEEWLNNKINSKEKKGSE